MSILKAGNVKELFCDRNLLRCLVTPILRSLSEPQILALVNPSSWMEHPMTSLVFPVPSCCEATPFISCQGLMKRVEAGI